MAKTESPKNSQPGTPQEAGTSGKNASDGSNSLDVSKFLVSTRQELAKVVWPSRQQLISESVAVILMVTLSATLIYLVDQFFIWLSGKVF